MEHHKWMLSLPCNLKKVPTAQNQNAVLVLISLLVNLSWQFRKVPKAEVLITAKIMDTFERLNYKINMVCNVTIKAEALSEPDASR